MVVQFFFAFKVLLKKSVIFLLNLSWILFSVSICLVGCCVIFCGISWSKNIFFALPSLCFHQTASGSMEIFWALDIIAYRRNGEND